MSVQISKKHIEDAIAKYKSELNKKTKKSGEEGPRQIITISRQIGSGGRIIAEALAEKLKITLWGKRILEVIADQSGWNYHAEMFDALDEKSQNIIDLFISDFAGKATKDSYFYLLPKAICVIAQNDAILLGRCAHLVLQDAFNVHINFGWDGPDGLELPDTWYNYYGHFPTFDPNIWFDDINYRKGLYIRMDPTFDSFIGPECAKLPDTCEFMVRTDFDTDPPLEFFFDWGDGSNSGWLGHYRLGETCTASHSWREPGIFDVKVKVKNAMGAEGDWSESLKVHITKFGFLLPLLEILINLKNRYPGLEPLLNPLIKILCR